MVDFQSRDTGRGGTDDEDEDADEAEASETEPDEVETSEVEPDEAGPRGDTGAGEATAEDDGDTVDETDAVASDEAGDVDAAGTDAGPVSGDDTAPSSAEDETARHIENAVSESPYSNADQEQGWATTADESVHADESGHADEDAHDHHGGEHDHGSTHAHGTDADQVGVAVVTISSTRSREDDPSGDVIESELAEAGHEIATRDVIRDDLDGIQNALVSLTARADVDAVVTTGGTGVTPDDVTVEAVSPLFDKELPGFGELFRVLSYEDVGSKAIASRATAGIVDERVVFCLPGSEDAVRLGLEELVVDEIGHLVGLATRGE